MEDKDIINILPLNKKTIVTAQQILDTDNIEDTQRLIKLFNLAQAKKNVIRVLKLNELLDTVQDEMIERFRKNPDEFTNGDLLNYFQVSQSAIDRANKSLNLVDEMPAIQVNQVNIVNTPESITRESREKVTQFVQNILSGLKIDKEATTVMEIEGEVDANKTEEPSEQ